jgi:hypothetical protein
MAIFSDVDLDDFADLAEELALKDSCEILRDDSTDSDGSGGYQNITWPVVATVACLISDAGRQPTEPIIAAKLDGKTFQTIMLPRGTDVRESDRLRINGTTTYHIIDVSTETYEVLKSIFVWRE